MNPSQTKVALVTGASSGIGQAAAAALAAEGYRVFGTSRNAKNLGPGVAAVKLDVTSDSSAKACVAAVLKKTGRLDVLVNNAGYLLAGAVEECSLKDAQAQFQTNYFGAVRMTQAVLPAMRMAGQGHIITVSSLAGLVPLPFWGHYNASKFALEGLMETLRMELKPLGIRVCMVEPGAIKTAFYGQAPAKGLPAYALRRKAMRTVMAGFEAKAPGPAAVGARIAQLAQQKRPALRNLVTKEAHLFTFLRWILPARVNEFGTMQAFMQG
jgi:NAD(P)-dependent dehydrogenase (short-subunit alcohol dehydrogenase family)